MRYDYIPEVTGNLRKSDLKVPEAIRKCTGIRIFGKRIKSFIFTTDVAIIKNTNADAVLAVYPFTPQPAISQAILSVSDIPVVCGVGGGLTYGMRSANIALHAEFQGAIGVILNAPAPNETIRSVKDHIDIPVIATVITARSDIKGKIEAGADILNVSGGKATVEIIKEIRASYPDIPIIATGGSTEESIIETIEAGANSIIYTPPSISTLFRGKMSDYREGELNE
ncbi:MAG: hydrolase [Cellulosilyticum sp.]|nr:hydrolase [Cellulosilyticum sp.]